METNTTDDASENENARPGTIEEYTAELECRLLEQSARRNTLHIGYVAVATIPFVAGLAAKWFGFFPNDESTDGLISCLGTVSVLTEAVVLGYTLGRIGENLSSMRTRRELLRFYRSGDAP